MTEPRAKEVKFWKIRSKTNKKFFCRIKEGYSSAPSHVYWKSRGRTFISFKTLENSIIKLTKIWDIDDLEIIVLTATETLLAEDLFPKEKVKQLLKIKDPSSDTQGVVDVDFLNTIISDSSLISSILKGILNSP